MIAVAKSVMFLVLVVFASMVTFCQTPQDKRIIRKHKKQHTSQVSKYSHPTPAETPPGYVITQGDATLAMFPYNHETYIVHPDGRWEWLPPGPTEKTPHPIQEQRKRGDSF